MHELATDDPLAFLERFESHVIIDEAQRVPSLFSCMQGVVDRANEPGQFVLSGSQNFLLLNTISQSLAGRAAVLHLLPLSFDELRAARREPATLDEFLFRGGYPRVHAWGIDPADFYPSYISTYVDRDVRLELGVKKIAEFTTFLTLCATRIGEVLNIDGLARDCGISPETARSWLGILEASFVVFCVRPYHSNFGKRLIKAPKLYFYDTGLAANLLGVEQADELFANPCRGALYENAVAVEIMKAYYAAGRQPCLYYWRDSAKNEIDFILDKGGRPFRAIEVKSSSTYKPAFFGTMDKLAGAMGLASDARIVVYGGAERFDTSHGRVAPLSDVAELVR
jgi:hypothetical protein